MKKLIAGFLFSIVLSSVCDAADTKSGCGHFHLQISNLTGVACILTNEKIIHGNLISSPPMIIMPNDSKTFDMEQTGLGPSIRLTYQCGDQSIAFTSQQNVCLIEAGDITGTLSHPLPLNLNASYTVFMGSYFWTKPGSINWRLFFNVS